MWALPVAELLSKAQGGHLLMSVGGEAKRCQETSSGVSELVVDRLCLGWAPTTTMRFFNVFIVSSSVASWKGAEVARIPLSQRRAQCRARPRVLRNSR